MATSESIVSNKQLKLPAESLKDNPFTVYIHINTEGGWLYTRQKTKRTGEVRCHEVH